MNYVIAFVAMFALDFVWARYTRTVADGRKLPASAWAVGILIFNAAATIAYVDNPWTLIPAALGAFAGTYVSVIPK